jgi:hypothetical protein
METPMKKPDGDADEEADEFDLKPIWRRRRRRVRFETHMGFCSTQMKTLNEFDFRDHFLVLEQANPISLALTSEHRWRDWLGWISWMPNLEGWG